MGWNCREWNGRPNSEGTHWGAYRALKARRKSGGQRTYRHHCHGRRGNHQFLLHPAWEPLDPGHHRVSSLSACALFQDWTNRGRSANYGASARVAIASGATQGRRNSRRVDSRFADDWSFRARYCRDSASHQGCQRAQRGIGSLVISANSPFTALTSVPAATPADRAAVVAARAREAAIANTPAGRKLRQASAEFESQLLSSPWQSMKATC